MSLGIVATGLTLVISAPAGAGEPAYSMPALDARLAPGTQVDVIDRRGRVVRGDFVRADGSGVLIAGFADTESNLISAADVVSVTRAGDSLKNGMWIGAAVGVLGAIAVATDDTGESGCYTTGCKVGLGIVAVPMYVGIGALIDKAIKGREVVYRAPSDRVSWSIAPHLVARGAAVRVAVRF
jgi:hypothetical protein